MQTIRQWLENIGLPQYAEIFEAHDIEPGILTELSAQDFDRLGVSLGHQKRLLISLRGAASPVPVRLTPDVTASTPSAIESLTAQGERRQVTILFCDLVESTALSSVYDPEEYRAILSRYHGTCIQAVQRYEGFLAQIQGDGIVAYFGYPLAHENDAERAIRAALFVVESLAKLDGEDAKRLRVRIGIASGLVVVSHILASEKSAVGETPNLAARLQTLAQPGEVIISERTWSIAAGSFEYEFRGTHVLKGIPDPTRAWRVLESSDVPSRFDAATRGRLTPMVGREQEIRLLEDRWELSRKGEGQVVLLQGEPGIGKSRMLRAFRDRLDTQIKTTLQYQCSPYHINSAFYPIANHLERALNFERNDSPAQKLDKIDHYLLSPAPLAEEAALLPLSSAGGASSLSPGGTREHLKRSRGLGRGGSTRSRTDCSLLARALSIPCEERYGPLDMSSPKQKDETVRLLVDLVASIALTKPTAMLFEDVHWADPTTIDLLGALINRTEKLPLLILITYRPEFIPPWHACSHLSMLALTRLSRTQGASIVLRVAREKPLPSDLVTQIVDKTDGVPLFLEELTKAILESPLIINLGDRYDYSGSASKLTIPNTLRDSLMARLDRLIPVKEIAQIGACLGREFSQELVSAVSPMNEAQLVDALEKLTASELVFRRGAPPGAVYVFKHALVRDAAYDSLLKAKRQELHAQIAKAIHERFPSKTDTEPEVVAHHFTEAGMTATAIPYWIKAGELAQKRVALQEAIGYFERGLSLAQSLPDSVERETYELQLRTLLGMAWVALQGYTHPQVLANLEPALRLDQELAGGDHTLRILWGLWVYRMCIGEIGVSLAWAERLITTAEERKNDDMRIAGHWTACNSHYFLGNFRQSIDHADIVLATYDARRHRLLAELISHDPKTVALAYKSGAEWILGYPDRAKATARAAIANADTRQHAFDMCWVRVFTAHEVFNYVEDVVTMASSIERCEQIAADQKLLFFLNVYCPLIKGLRLLHVGPAADARSQLAEALSQWTSAGMLVANPPFKAQYADSAARCGDIDSALVLLDESLDQIERPTWQERYGHSNVLRIKACVLQQAGRSAEAELSFQNAMDVARGQQAKSWELRAATDYARFLNDNGNTKTAKALLEPIYHWFTEGHDSRDLRAARELLDELALPEESATSASAGAEGS
jgi:class 3 adenylate cyclase/predicted ATPase